jgi:glycine betaine/proline transport system substrate-binding protein
MVSKHTASLKASNVCLTPASQVSRVSDPASATFSATSSATIKRMRPSRTLRLKGPGAACSSSLSPAYMDARSINQLNGTDARLIYGIEASSVVMHKVEEGVIPAYHLKQQLVQGGTAGMLYKVGRLYATREDFVFIAWSPHWMNQRYDIRYLKDPKDALGPTNDPARLSTIVRGGLREGDPEAYALMDAMELDEGQIEGLEDTINKSDDPGAGARRWVSENREVVRPWIEAARNAS